MASGRRTLEPTKGELEIIRKSKTVQEAATECGRARDTIRRWRNQYLPDAKGQPGRPRRDVPEDLLAKLGTAPDAVLAGLFKVPKNTVRNYRMERAIPAYPRPGALAA